MKTGKQGIAIAMVAIITIAIIGCSDGGGSSPPPEQPVATTYDLTFGDIKITLHYQKKPSDPVPAYIDRIQNRLTSMAGNPANTLKSRLTDRNGNYSINVVYDGTPFDGFRATDGQTIEAHNTWLTANAATIESADLSGGFNAMLALPPLDENGVPYYGTLPNTTIKIYKGDATVTDVQMTTAVQNVIAGYNGLSATVMAMVQGKFTKVIIITDKNYSWDGSVLGLKFDRSADSITGRFESVADGSLVFTSPGHDENGVPYYGSLPDTAIKIYKGDAGVTDEQMTTAITTATNAFGRLTQTEKTAVNNTLTKIRILSVKEYTWDGHILGAKFDTDEEVFLGGLQAIAVDGLPLAE
jgi:hypothetical protein